MVKKELTGVLRLDPINDLPRIKLESLIAVGAAPEQTVLAQQPYFGLNLAEDKAHLELKKSLRSQSDESLALYASYVLMRNLLDFAGIFDELLRDVQPYAYGLLNTDIEQSNSGQQREVVILDATLTASDLSPEEKKWVGPHHYSMDSKLVDQLPIIAKEQGINCQVLVHVVLEYLGYRLAKDQRSLELFNRQHLDLTKDQLKRGDIVFFHKAKGTPAPASLHMALVLGRDIAGMPWVIQATSQPNKLAPATEVVPITTVLSDKNRYFYGAVRINTIVY